MTAGASLLGEAELHGLVDGHLAAERRADVLRKLAVSPADRAVVEAWQEQNDAIRAAFRDVERETLPVALDLAPPRLRCIEGGIEGDPGRPLPPLSMAGRGSVAGRAAPAGPGRRASRLATLATVLVVGVGLAASWLVFDPVRQDAPATIPRAGTEAALADRAVAALEDEPTAETGPPVFRIPDLAASGLRLTDVSMQSGMPGSLVLRYRDPRGARVVLGIAGAADPGREARTTQPETVGKTLVWRRSGVAYTLAGTLPAERLRALAGSIQDGNAKE